MHELRFRRSAGGATQAQVESQSPVVNTVLGPGAANSGDRLNEGML